MSRLSDTKAIEGYYDALYGGWEDRQADDSDDDEEEDGR